MAFAVGAYRGVNAVVYSLSAALGETIETAAVAEASWSASAAGAAASASAAAAASLSWPAA
jgi:hypothetical protein